MPSASYLQTSFLGGEWSPYAQGRADLETYRTAMNLCYNNIPLEVGACTRRPGTLWCGTTLNGQPAVLRQFHFSQNAPYNIEFTNLAMRFWAGNQLVPGTTATPYPLAALQAIRVVQEENFALTLHPSYPPQTLAPLTQPVPGAPATFSYSPTVFQDGPYLDPPTDGTTLTPNQVGTGLTLTASAITSINGGKGFLPTDVGRAIRLYSQPVTWDATTNWVTGNNVFWKGVPYVATQNAGHAAPDADISTTWAIAPSAAQWTWGTIATVISTTQVTVTLAAADPFTVLAGGPLLYVQAMPLWQLGVYSATTGYPGGGFFHEGRLWLFGTTSNRIDSTMSGVDNANGIDASGPPCFSPTLLDGTPADNCGISAIMMGEEQNTIFWGAPDHQGIILGTQGGEWLVQASSLNEPLTPTSIQAHRVTKFGCANVEPRMAGFSHLFVQRYSQQLYEYVADVYSGKFAGTNVARKAKHLTAPGIAEIAYQAELVACLWARTTDNRLIGMSYKRESPFTTQPATYVGWHQHFLGSGAKQRTVTSIQAGPSPDGSTDSVMMVTFNPGTGVYWVEQITAIFEETAPITAAWFVDAGVVPTVTVSGPNLVLSGLPHPPGDTVAAWVGGYDLGNAVVSLTGTITVPAIAGAPTTPAVVGYPYVSKGQMLRPVLPAEGGWQTGPGQGKLRRSHYAAPLLAQSQGVYMGVDFASMRAMKFMSAGGTVPLAPNVLFSGVYWEPVDDTYSFNSMWCWQTTRPYPTTLVSVEVMIVGQDNA